MDLNAVPCAGWMSTSGRATESPGVAPVPEVVLLPVLSGPLAAIPYWARCCAVSEDSCRWTSVCGRAPRTAWPDTAVELQTPTAAAARGGVAAAAPNPVPRTRAAVAAKTAAVNFGLLTLMRSSQEG